MSWPTTTDPRENLVTVRFTDDEITDLDALAAATGVSRSAVIRNACDAAVSSHKRSARRQKGLTDSNSAGA